MNRKDFIKGVPASVFILSALLKSAIPHLHIPAPPPLNVMLISPGKPHRYYATITEAYENVTTVPMKDNELILVSGFRWVI